MAISMAKVGPLTRPADFQHAGALTEDAVQAMLRRFYHVPTVVSSSGAILPQTQARYLITKSGVAALTLAAPVAGDDDNTEIEFVSTTTNAHTVTFPSGILKDGSGAHTICTFASVAGASMRVVAYNGFWYVLDLNGITLS
jgi:hypothetical protein